MSYPYVLLAIAQEEYDSAIEWYAARSIKATEALITEIENALSLICNNPNRWRSTYKNFRELGVHKFPYVIIYTFDENINMVIVTAIFHTSRNPIKKYRKR